MVEDPQPGPVSSKGQPAIGVRLTLMFLAAARGISCLAAAAFLSVCLLLVLAESFAAASPTGSILRILLTLFAAEIMIAMAIGGKWIEDLIEARAKPHDRRGVDPLDSVGNRGMVMIEIVLILSCFIVFLWILMAISPMRSFGPIWPAFWLLLGGLAWWGRRELLRRLALRAAILNTDPYSTPEIPPSGEP